MRHSLVLFTALALASLSQPAFAITDYYSTGPATGIPDQLDDVWQSIHNAWGLSPSADEDKDGCSNYVESLAGTDPRNSTDCLSVGNMAISAGSVVVTFKAEKGKKYQVWESESPVGAPPAAGWTLVSGASKISAEDHANDTMVFTKPADSRKFYRLESLDADSDNDGVSDWAENKLGMNPAIASSTGNGASDGDTLNSLLSLTVTSTQNGFERDDKTATTPAVVPAKVKLVRTVGTMALNGLSLIGSAGAPDAVKANATPPGTNADYTLASFSIPAGQGVPGTPYEALVTPAQDAVDEVPEYARITVDLPGTISAPGPSGTVCICDSDPANPANNQLYVAYLGHEAGQATTASGYATALVNGDNTSASISVVFSNLSSEQNTAYIRFGPNNDLAPALPTGQVSGQNYNIVYKPGFVSTDQAFLDALRTSNIWCAITSANFPDKEIAGPFNKATGSVTFDPNNPTLDAPSTGSTSWQTATSEQIERDIWRFMTQSTWGGTQAMYEVIRAKVDARIGALSGTPTAAQITEAYIQGLSDWLDDQMNPALTPSINFRTLVMSADNEEFELRGNKAYTYSNDPSFNGTRYAVTYDAAGNPTVSTTADNNFSGNNYPQSGPNRRREWWSIILQSKDQVRQRFAQALSEIVVISEADQTTLDRHYGCANYWDMLAANAFGKYRSLLEKVTYSPMMGIYLSHMSNRAAYDAGGGIVVSPDENYAREIMQLFSIGLVLRHPDGSLQLDGAGLPIPTYDQRDITELARVMTGFSHGARHAVGYTSSWNNTNLVFNNSSNNRVSDLVIFNYNPSVTASNFSSGNNVWFGRTDDHLFWAAPWINPMKVIGRISDATPTTAGTIVYHDFNQYIDPDTTLPVSGVSKRLLAGKHGQYDVPMRTLPALGRGANDITCNNLADQDLTEAHNALAGDPTQSTYGDGSQASPGHTNTPVNISRWLIQRLITSNPSAGYIFRVQDAYRNSNGNLGSVLKAILLDYEARSLQFADSSISHGKVKEPLVAFAQMLRTLRAFSGAPVSTLRDRAPNMSGTDTPMPSAYPVSEFNKFSTDNASPPSLPVGWATGPFRYRFGDLTGNIGQSPQRAPSVFNWFLPDFVVPGPMAEAGLFAPELQINTEASVVAKVNMFYAYTWSNLVGMSTQPGADSNVSDFILNNSSATPAVRLSLDGGATFVNSVTFTPTDYGAKTVTVVGGNTNWLTSVDNSLLRFSVSGSTGYDQLPVQPMTIGFQDNDQANEGIRAEHTFFNTWVQEGGKTDTVSVRLFAPPPAGSTVTVDVTAGSQVSMSPTSLSFTDANWNTVQTVTVTAVQDATTEAPGTAGDTLTFTSSSSAASYNGLIATLPVSVVDDDDGASSYDVLVTTTGTTTDTLISETTATTVAEGTVDEFEIVLTKAPSANVTVTISLSNTQAQINTQHNGTTFQSTAVTRTFTTTSGQAASGSTSGWNVPQKVRIRGTADTTAEASFFQNPTNNTIVTITANSGGYATANPVQQVVAKINDDDNRIIMTPTDGETLVQEGGVTDTFTVSLRVAPTVPVTVNLGSNHVRCTPTNLVFHPTGGTPGPGETLWNVAQTVTVTAIDDHLNEGRMMALLPNAIATTGTGTSTITSNAVSAVTMTNQGAGYTVPPIVSFSGGGGTGAAAVPILSADGKITGLTITGTGSGYTSAPTVTITPPFSASAAIVASATSANVADTGYNNYWNVTHSAIGVNILDNDNAGVNVVASGGDTNVVEGGSTDSVDISLRQQPASDVTITLSASAQATVSPATLTFTSANWNIAQTATITAVNDATVEPDTLTNIGVVVTSSDAAYAGVKTKAIAVTVLDNDFVPLGIGHSNGWTTVAEGGAAGNSSDTLVRVSDTFTVNLGRTPTANVTVTLVTDGQVTVSPSVLTFTSGNSSTNQTVTVTAVEDIVAESALHNSLVRFTITSTDPFYNNPRNNPMNIPVRDNDANGIALFESNGNTQPTEGGTDSITVVLTKAPASNVVVSLTSSNTAEATVPTSLTFSTTNWATPQSFNVTAVGDMINEGREVHSVTAAVNPTGSDPAYVGLPAWTYDGYKAVGNPVINYVLDNHRRNENLIVVPTGGTLRSNDAQPSGGNTWVTEGSSETDSVDIYLASPPASPVTVTLDANAQMGFNQSVFFFDSTNWNVPQTVVVSAIDDPVNDTSAATAQSQNIQFRCFGDPTYFGVAPTTAVNILDNDSPAVSISQTSGITNTVEGGASDTYSVVLTTPPNGNVVVRATRDSSSLLNGLAANLDLTFNATNWNVPQVVTVAAVNDASVEGLHRADITHAIVVASTTDTTGYAANNAGTSTLSLQTVVNNIEDDDNRIIVSVTGLETRVHEDGSKADSYSIVLRSAPTANVTITPSVSGGFAAAGLAVSPSTLVFNNTNWSTPQSFTLTGVNNGIDAERARTVTVSHTSASSDGNYNAQTIHQVAVSQLSTDNTRVLVVGNPAVHENGNTSSYTVALNRAPTANVTITATANPQLEIAPPVPVGGVLTYSGSAVLTFTPANWMTHQTVAVRAIDDALVESIPHFGLITHTAASTDTNYDGAPVANTHCLITDNEFPAVRIIPSGGSTLITESGTSDTYNIVLSQAPTADVTVSITPDAQSTVSSPSVTFTTSDWSVPQTITVTAVNDGTTEGNHTSTLIHGNAVSTDPTFSGLAVPFLKASITDNDGPQVVLAESGGSTAVVEAGTSDTFTIQLSQAPTANVTVTFSPPVYIIPPPAYAKQVGYFTSDLSGSNQQRDRIVMDYTELIQLYRDTFYDHLEGVYGTGAIPLVPSDLNLQNAHWAASKAIVDKTDLWWCGGSLKARNPVLIEPNQALPTPMPPANPRQVLMECIYQINGGINSLGTTRYEPEIVFDPKNPPNTTFANEIRDRCRWIGYLNSTVMPGFVQH